MQPTQDFSARNLLWMRGHGLKSSLTASAPRTGTEWKELAAATELEISTGAFSYRGLFTSIANGKKVLSTNSVIDAIVLRKINDNIRRSYGVRQAQRSQCVRIVSSAVSEWTPKGIVRVDLRSCFESIPPQSLIEKLRTDGRVSHLTIALLEQFLRQARFHGSNRYREGLPRGILLSSTLAELYLRELDRRANLIEGLYTYVRYVDDIVAISSRPPDDTYSELVAIAKDLSLDLNRTKTKLKISGCECGLRCIHPSGQACPCANSCNCRKNKPYDWIEFLGYKLIYLTGQHISKKGGACHLLLADKKCRRIKSRISAAISELLLSKDLELFSDRLKFLTRNVAIDHRRKGSTLRAGLAYSHHLYAALDDSTEFGRSNLESLDKYLRTKVRRVCLLLKYDAPTTKSLLKNSFLAGFKHRHRSRFTPSRLKLIRRCWTHV